MKILRSAIAALLITASQFADAQIKVFPQNKVQVGPLWWSTFPVSQQLFVNGDTYINCRPSASGLLFQNYVFSYQSSNYNLPAILPQWGNSAFIGTANTPIYRIYSQQLHSYNGGVFGYSDSTLKENITPILSSDALAKILAMKAYTFDYKASLLSDSETEIKDIIIDENKNQVGVLAQELKEILPQAVKRDSDNDPYCVNYIAIIPILIEALKAQQAKINALEQRILTLEQ